MRKFFITTLVHPTDGINNDFVIELKWDPELPMAVSIPAQDGSEWAIERAMLFQALCVPGSWVGAGNLKVKSFQDLFKMEFTDTTPNAHVKIAAVVIFTREEIKNFLDDTYKDVPESLEVLPDDYWDGLLTNG